MKEVAAKLEHIRSSLPYLKVDQNFEENTCTIMEMTGPLGSNSSSERSCLNCNKASVGFMLQKQSRPLIKSLN